VTPHSAGLRGLRTVSRATFVRLVRATSKDEALATALASVRAGSSHPSVYSVIQQAFSALPDSPFAYWLSDAMRGKFRELPRLEGRAGQVRQGLATGDDFRFVRAAWEVSPKNISIPCEEPLSSKRWAPFAKGGEYRPLFEGIHLLVNWADDGA